MFLSVVRRIHTVQSDKPCRPLPLRRRGLVLFFWDLTFRFKIRCESEAVQERMTSGMYGFCWVHGVIVQHLECGFGDVEP